MSKKLSLMGSGRVRIKNMLPVRITHKISKTNSNFHVKWRTTAKV